MPKPKITLFVDIVSPFAYIGFYALQVGSSLPGHTVIFGSLCFFFEDLQHYSPCTSSFQTQQSRFFFQWALPSGGARQAYELIHRAANSNQNFPVFKQCEVTYVPIFLGGLFNLCGNTTPLSVKSEYPVSACRSSLIATPSRVRALVFCYLNSSSPCLILQLQVHGTKYVERY